jgi:hypothetical protein
MLKWTFLTQLTKLKKQGTPSYEDIKRIETQFFSRQMNRLGDLNSVSFEQLRMELKEARQEINALAV